MSKEKFQTALKNKNKLRMSLGKIYWLLKKKL